MKLGVGSFTYTWAIGVPGYLPSQPMSALDLLDTAHALGVSVVQYGDNLPLIALDQGLLEELIARARDYEIHIELGTRGIGTENVLRHVDLAQKLGSPFIRFVIDTDADHPSTAEVVARLTPLMPAFAGAGVKLAIENHDRFAVAELVRIVEALGPNHCGVCLDTVNSLGVPESPGDVVEALAPYTLNLHLKDFQIHRVPSNMGFTVTGCPVGRGRLNVPWLLGELRTRGRDVNAIVELWTPFQDDLPATVALERSWAAASVDAMQALFTA